MRIQILTSFYHGQGWNIATSAASEHTISFIQQIDYALSGFIGFFLETCNQTVYHPVPPVPKSFGAVGGGASSCKVCGGAPVLDAEAAEVAGWSSCNVCGGVAFWSAIILPDLRELPSYHQQTVCNYFHYG